MQFDLYVGIDYSGAETARSRLASLQVYAMHPNGSAPERWYSPTPSNNGQRVNWTRREIAERLRDDIGGGKHLLVGIDHGFSFPVSYFDRYGLKSWPEFLTDFAQHWPTHQDYVYVDFVRDGSLYRHGHTPPPGQRVGNSDEFRLTEKWTSSAKSVFRLDGQGTVGKSTHAGIPWLLWLREELGGAVHFWPFDGWMPPVGKAVIAEVYPSIFRNRYPRGSRTPDEQDAYATARWMSEMAARDALAACFTPPLTLDEQTVASLEGWILGVR
jgi:hypothetical protein